MSDPIRVTIWNEFRHEKSDDDVKAVYPDGIHTAIAKGLSQFPSLEIRTATLDEPEHGLTEEVLENTDVLMWWGHMAHDDVKDEIVERVHARILGGMGLVAMHSAHYSKIFRKLMGTTCSLKWREIGEKERLWIVKPGHQIVEGIEGEFIELEHTEMYGEFFDIPTPDDLVFISWFQGGEVFRSGCCYHRGKGKIFYFRPGHETYPIFYNEKILRVLANGLRWAAPVAGPQPQFDNKPPLEPVPGA